MARFFKKRHKTAAILVGSTAGLIIWATGFLPGGLELSVTHFKTGRVILLLPLNAGERFTLRYIHSVEESPVWEVHSLDETGRIYVEEERYLKFGAGMGKMPGVGRMVMRGPYEVIEEMHMPTGEFILRVGGTSVDHTLIWRGIATHLSAVVPHVPVRFAGRPISLRHKLWRFLSPHPATPVERNP